MTNLEHEVRIFCARRLLDLISPSAVVAWAAEALAAGRESPELVSLASIQEPSAETVDSALGELSDSLSLERLSVSDSVELLALLIVRRILDGSLDPLEGARDILRIDARGDGLPALYPIRAAMSEADSDRVAFSEYREDLLRAAGAFAEWSRW